MKLPVQQRRFFVIFSIRSLGEVVRSVRFPNFEALFETAILLFLFLSVDFDSSLTKTIARAAFVVPASFVSQLTLQIDFPELTRKAGQTS